MKEKVKLFDEAQVNRALTRLSYEIVEKSGNIKDIVLIGIKTRGVPMAKIIAKNIAANSGFEPPVEELDISFYRDDLPNQADPSVKECHFSESVTDKEIIIVDDVLYTGRTIRAAIEAIFSQGRPGKISLAVLVDRGHRELPIRPDYIGKNVPTSQKEEVIVHLKEIDGKTEVSLYSKE